jgi:GNAT superfamily N-acetyltransferase
MSKLIDTKVIDYKLRFAEERDVPLILDFIKELAIYENMLDDVVATEGILKNSLFNRKAAEVIIGEYKGEAVSFALFFHNFSTFLGKPGLYLEDLFVRPEARGKGFGKILLTFLANLAKERDCGRFEWSCLDWNEPSIKFYKQMGAKPTEDWTGYRLEGKTLDVVAEEF